MLSHDVDYKPQTGPFFIPKEPTEPYIPLKFPGSAGHLV